MLEISVRSSRAWVGALLVAGVACTAHAQTASVLTETGSGTYECVNSTGTDGCAAGGVACGIGSTCRSLGSGVFRCFPNDTVFCCNDGALCPAGGTCTLPRDFDQSICLPGHDYCAGSTDAPTLSRIEACHTSATTSAFPVSWAAGDCDGDGIPNQLEVDNGTDFCLASGPIEIYTDAGCAALSTGCSPVGSACTDDVGGAGTCQRLLNLSATFCRPSEPALACCNVGDICAAGSECVSVSDGDHVCAQQLCPDASGIEPLDCITAPDGSIVPAAQGDCDGDGIANGDEQGLRTNPCVADAPDAGTQPEEDAGTEEPDAGSSAPDGGVKTMDAGAPMHDPGVTPRFEGGGGCVCRTAPSAPGHGLAWLGLAALAILIRRRR